MHKITRKNLFLSVAIVFAFAVVGAMLTGDALENWFREINQPWFSLPLWGWYVIGVLYYAMAATILFRLFTLPFQGLVRNAIWLSVAMLAANELWNYMFFGFESAFLGFVVLIPFTVLVVILFVVLRVAERKSSWILLPYVIWLGYDLIWTYHLWKLNE